MAKSPIRSQDEVLYFHSLWDIGSSGAHTKTSGVPGSAFSGVAQTATGKYTVSFSLGALPQGRLIDLILTHHAAADAANMNLRPTVSTWTPESGSTAATVKYESWDNDTTAQTELSSGDKVGITAVFLKTKALS